MKKFFLLTVIFTLFGMAANAQPKDLIGTWKSTTMDVLSDGVVLMSMNCDVAGVEMSFTFMNGGKCVASVVSPTESETENVTYKVVGTTIILTDESGEDMPMIYKDGKLVMEQKEDGMDIRMNFEKQ